MPLTCSSAIGSDHPLETALNRVKQTGLQTCDLLTIQGWAHVNPGDLADDWETTNQRVDALLAQHQLKLVSLNAMLGTKMNERTPEAEARRTKETQALLKFMHKHGIKTIALQPPLKWQETWSNEEQDLCIQTLREQLTVAHQAGVTFALELHTRSPFETMEQVNRLLTAMPEVPLVYDATHFVLQGIPIRDTTWMLKNAVHAHLRDAAPGKLQAPFGKGEVDFDWLLNALRDTGYKGMISIEYLGNKNADFDVIDSTRRLADKIREYFAE